MIIKLKIDNPDIEKMLLEFTKDEKEITLEKLRAFLNQFYKGKEFSFKKRDPKKYSKKLDYLVNENLDDVIPYSYIEDSAEYIHNLRRLK